MIYFLICLAIILSGIITYQDFRFRAVSWLLFPGLFLSLFAITYYDTGALIAVKNTIYNTVLLSIQLSIVLLYFFIRKGTIKKFTSHIMGWGDMLFLISITSFFSVPMFLIFIFFSFLFSLLIYLGMHVLNAIDLNTHTIPLAGILAVFMIIVLLIRWIYPQCIYRLNGIFQFI